MFMPTLRCECAQPGLIDTMRKWSIRKDIYGGVPYHMRPEADLPYCVEQTGDNEFII